VADGTNALPVVVNGTVQIDPLDTLDVNVVNTSIPITNTNLDSLSFTTDKGIDYLNVNAVKGFPIANEVMKSTLYNNGGLIPVDVDADGALLVRNVPLSNLNFVSSTGGNNLQVQLFNGSTTISSTNPLLVRTVASTITTNAWTIANFSGTGVGSVSEALEASNSNSITVFGTSTHSGGGGDPTLTYQYSLDNITYYDTPYLITLPNATAFEDTRTLGVPWVRFKITSHALDTLTLNICRK
jgi:hypothetical protein